MYSPLGEFDAGFFALVLTINGFFTNKLSIQVLKAAWRGEQCVD